jgi:exosortase
MTEQGAGAAARGLSAGRGWGALLLAIAGGLAAVVIWPWLVHAAGVWATVEAFGFGFFVPPVTAGLIWWRWPALRASAGDGAWGGLLVVAVALGAMLVGARAGLNALGGVAAVLLLWGIAVSLWGWRAGRVLAFPIGFLAFGLGAHTGALNGTAFALQGATAAGAGTLGHLLGLGVVREGLVLRGPSFAFVVAEQCSGMSSLLSLLALASLWGFLAAGSLPARLALVASVAPLVLLANILRVTLVLGVAALFGQDVAVGFFHEASSLVLFGVAAGGMLLVGRRVGCQAPRRVAWS